MVKLIRMVADRNTSTNEIRNTFNPAFTMEPKSRIALHSVRANLAIGDNYQFIITNENNTLIFSDVTGVPLVTVPLIADTYNLSQFRTELITSITLLAGRISGNSSGNQYELPSVPGSGVFKLVKKSAQLVTFNWIADDYIILSGTPDIDSSVPAYDIDMNSSPDPVDVELTSLIPNSSFVCQGKIDTLDDFGMLIKGEGDTLFGLGVSGGNYFTTFPNGTPEVSAITASAGDDFKINRLGNVVTFTTTSSPQLDVQYTVTRDDQRRINEADEGIHLHFIAPPGSQAVLKDLKATLIPTRGPTGFLAPQVFLNLLFGSESLAKYCGFNTVGPHKATGSPAILVGDERIEGDLQNPGVIVTIDPLILETYDGDQRNTRFRGQNNILYVLNNIKGKNVEMSDALIPLDLNNADSMQINQLRIQFRNQANGDLLEFNGEPSLVLVVYGPEELTMVN